MNKPWKPRSSYVAAYHNCERRAWYDKAIHDGVIEMMGDHSSSPYADLGTLIHEPTQHKLGCIFPFGKFEDPRESLLANASTLFKGDMAATERAIDAASDLAARSMPATSDGKPWLAEEAFDAEFLTGHIDFLSQDHSVIIDLKTTTRKPDHNRIKAPHLIQLCMYHLLTGKKAKTGRILYVDSLKASWAILSQPVEFDNPFVADFVSALHEKIDWLRAMDTRVTSIMPRPGTNCESDFCPYRAECRDKLIPPSTPVLLNTEVDALPKTVAFSL